MPFSTRGHWNEYEVSWCSGKEEELVGTYYAENTSAAVDKAKEDVAESGMRIPKGSKWSAKKV